MSTTSTLPSVDDDDNAAPGRDLQSIQRAKDARLCSTPPPGMLWCHTGPHAVEASELAFCPKADLGLHDYTGPLGPQVRRFCKRHFPLYLASQRSKDKTNKRAADASTKQQRMAAPLADGMGRCCIGPHDVPLTELTFCPVADLGLTAYRGPKGVRVRRHCRRHFLGNIEVQRKHKRARDTDANQEE